MSESTAPGAEIRERHREAAAEVVPEETGLFVDGEFVPAEAGERFAVRDPTTDEVLAEVSRGRAADVDRAVAAAETAFEDAWSGYSTRRRQELLTEVADRVEAEKEAFTRLEALDNGKAVTEAEADVDLVADQFRYFAGAARTEEGRHVPTDGTRSIRTIREPYGVVAAIVPWNFPLLMASYKLAPALAAGNAVVLKPAEQTPLSALKLAEIFQEVLPDGVVNVVPGFGEEAGEPLTTHPDVRKLAFTGSTVVGREVMRNAAADVTDVTLELGGKSPVVVFPDADVQTTVRALYMAILFNTGECCTAGSRLFVHEDVREEVLDSFSSMAENVNLGDPLESATRMGPKVSAEQVERTLGYLERARELGAEFVVEGGRPDDEALADGHFVRPSVIAGLDHDSEPVQEEIFGPVLTVFEWSDYEEMIALANDVDYGLAAGIMTEDVQRAHNTARDLEAGTIWVNHYTDFPAGQPFGGVKQSGIGRETTSETIEEYTQTKSVNVSLR